MNAYDNNVHLDALSDNELDAVSGGEDKVTKEDVKKALAPGAGLAPLDLAAWTAAVKAMK
jgi:hypothetical protein